VFHCSPAKIVSPIRNKYLNHNLGVEDSGCRCHSIMRVIVEDNCYEVDDSYIGKLPTFDKPVKELYQSLGDNFLIEKDGKLYFNHLHGDSDFPCIELEDGSCKYSSEISSAYKVEDTWYIQDTCPIYHDSLDSLLYKSKIKSTLDNLSDGTYYVLIELGCWESYHYEFGCEGEVEGDILVLGKNLIEE
jgi:hypothetical protein